MSDAFKGQPDRRRFMLGAAAVGAGAATGGLFGAAWAPTASAADLGLAGYKYPVPGYPGASLPFPTDPGQFLSMALKTVFGALQVCLCITPQGVMRLVTGDKVTANLNGGLGVSIGEGRSKQGKNAIEQAINVLLNPTDHISDGISDALGLISFRHDGERGMPQSGLSPLDPVRVFKRFAELFFNPLRWPTLAANFMRDPVGFFRGFIGLFFPAQQQMNFNVKVTCEKYPDLVLVNRNTIAMENGNAKEFPPRNAGYAPAGAVELVDINNPTGPTVVTIDQFNSVVSHKEGAPAQLSPQFVQTNVSQVVTVTSAPITPARMMPAF
ncbi:hypothetical protein SAMN05421505_12222 [Sinosporangium album]|uniref:Uncharacterized protein n=1 Tax=Sinosporangium album TaxID=504805 RepID=A0A1G8F2H3_9ACTN|nr:hypothetical protein [Sinosporangium album]SDH76301.1 hypothetical protein SAMN05421505_12222 [Sinosporangium album]